MFQKERGFFVACLLLLGAGRGERHRRGERGAGAIERRDLRGEGRGEEGGQEDPGGRVAVGRGREEEVLRTAGARPSYSWRLWVLVLGCGCVGLGFGGGVLLINTKTFSPVFLVLVFVCSLSFHVTYLLH